jgi:hypothetical protein
MGTEKMETQAMNLLLSAIHVAIENAR